MSEIPCVALSTGATIQRRDTCGTPEAPLLLPQDLVDDIEYHGENMDEYSSKAKQFALKSKQGHRVLFYDVTKDCETPAGLYSIGIGRHIRQIYLIGTKTGDTVKWVMVKYHPQENGPRMYKGKAYIRSTYLPVRRCPGKEQAAITFCKLSPQSVITAHGDWPSTPGSDLPYQPEESQGSEERDGRSVNRFPRVNRGSSIFGQLDSDASEDEASLQPAKKQKPNGPLPRDLQSPRLPNGARAGLSKPVFAKMEYSSTPLSVHTTRLASPNRSGLKTNVRTTDIPAYASADTGAVVEFIDPAGKSVQQAFEDCDTAQKLKYCAVVAGLITRPKDIAMFEAVVVPTGECVFLPTMPRPMDAQYSVLLTKLAPFTTWRERTVILRITLCED